jgi:hypothetical protein
MQRGEIHGAWLIAVGLDRAEEGVREARNMGVTITRFMLNRLIAFYASKDNLDEMLRYSPPSLLPLFLFFFFSFFSPSLIHV